jgi:hypothetical protein
VVYLGIAGEQSFRYFQKNFSIQFIVRKFSFNIINNQIHSANKFCGEQDPKTKAINHCGKTFVEINSQNLALAT